MEQARFFPQQDIPQPHKEVDTRAVADAIVAHAPSHPYAAQDSRAEAIVQLRGVDLRAEQTGVKEIPDTDSLPPPSNQAPERKFELPGRSTGRSNNQPPTRTELLWGMTDAEREEQHACNKQGAAVAREALRNTQRD